MKLSSKHIIDGYKIKPTEVVENNAAKLFTLNYAFKELQKILKLSSKHIIGRYNIKPTEVVENNAAKLFILNYAFEELQKI